jgi:baseplate J-like protein
VSAPDRLGLLLAAGQTQVTGIDFVFVDPNQTDLYVFFHHIDPIATIVPVLTNLRIDQIRIEPLSGGPAVTIDQLTVPWPLKDGRRVLHIHVTAPGGFVRYRLTIDDPRIDPFFNGVVFSFKANCPSDLDCAPPPHECPPDSAPDFPVDYRARDFWSFRQALIDFASARYPDWQDRLEADLGMTLLEAMSALGDEFSYAQDRIAREGYLETASQRRSLRHLARLVDYEPYDGSGATVWLDLDASAIGAVPCGASISDVQSQMHFEVGRGLIDLGHVFGIDPARNEFKAHLWDDEAACLEAGATSLVIDGHHAIDLNADPLIDPLGKWVLLATHPTDPAIPERRWIVCVTTRVESTDILQATPITTLAWDAAQATPFEMDLETLTVRANLVPATSGQTQPIVRFRVGPSSNPADPDAGLPRAVERAGSNGTLMYPDTLPSGPATSQVLQDARDVANRSTLLLFSLPASDKTPLVWLPRDAAMHPEVLLERETDTRWAWMRALIGEKSAKPNDKAFTLEDGMWRNIAVFHKPGGDVVHVDYASTAGSTIRFGENEFGMKPADGSVFKLTFRLANGRPSNVAADSLTVLETPLPFVRSVTNPLPASGGADAESADQIRINAPEAFRALTFRAVRPEDYAEAAERLSWVQKAGAAFRYTGSWLTAFVTPDPLGGFAMTPDERRELDDQLDRFRQAGRETHVSNPIYADVDLRIRICVEPNAYRGDVKERVLEALFGRRGAHPIVGFFDPDRFTFGTPLLRASLQAAIQDVPGVRAVEDLRIRRRGWFDWRDFVEAAYTPGDRELIRIVNSTLLPERGAVKLILEGGA